MDLLLVHGAEALSDTERAQDEFFHLFEALKRRGARVLIAADRPPSGIRGIDERLRSRFEGGLVLEVQGATVPSGADDITLRDPDEVTSGGTDEGERTSGERPVIPPLNELDMGEGRGGLFVSPDTDDGGREGGRMKVHATGEIESGEVPLEPGSPGGEEAGGRWVPSREKVVWYWPHLRDRLVEDLE